MPFGGLIGGCTILIYYLKMVPNASGAEVDVLDLVSVDRRPNRQSSKAARRLFGERRIFDPLVSFSHNAHPDSFLRNRHVPHSLGRYRFDGIDKAALVERVPETKHDAATFIRSPVVVQSFRKRESRPYVHGQRGMPLTVDVDHRLRRIFVRRDLGDSRLVRRPYELGKRVAVQTGNR